MRPTPRTDAEECSCPMYSCGEWIGVPETDYVPSAFARQLESENAELRAALKDCVEYAILARKLETDRAELADWLRVLADIPIQDFGWDKTPHQPLHGWNGYTIYAKDVLAARALLARLEAE